MLTYDLDQKGRTPLYEFLYACIRDDIISGRLAPGDRLPSRRRMAHDNGVAVVTVENAYMQLVIEGYAESRPKRGYFVMEGCEGRGPSRGEMGAQADSRLSAAGSELWHGAGDYEVHRDDTHADGHRPGPDLGTRRISDTAERDNSRENLTDLFPYSIWTRLMRRVLSDGEADFGTAPPPEGCPELRRAIADYLLDMRNLKVSPDNIIIGPGTEYLHSMIIALLGHNRLVAVEDPGYSSVTRIYESNGVKTVHIPMGDEGIDVSRLAVSGATIVHTSPAHHFPTGTVMSAAVRGELIDWAHSSDAYIIEDDYDSEFRFKGRPLPTLMSAERERVIYMNTFTETLAPSIRMAYMVLPDALVDVYAKRLGFLSGTVSTFDQLTMAKFISLGYYERHIGRMRNRYRILREKYREAFAASALARFAHVEDDPAGLRMVISFGDSGGGAREYVPGSVPDEAHPSERGSDAGFLSRLENAGIRVVPMNRYCYNPAPGYDHRYLMRYADPDPEKLRTCFDLMARIYEEECPKTAGGEI